MIHNERFEVDSSKLKRDYKICSLADIHNNSWASFELWDDLIDIVDSENPDYIFISGDFVYNSDDFYVSKNDRMLRYFLRSLSEIAETFMCLGNHELKSGRKFNRDDSIQYLRMLDRTMDIHILDKRIGEEFIDTEDIRIGGFCPRSETYYKSREREWSKYFIEDYLNSLLEFTKDKFNILLTHSPDTISQKEVLIALRDKIKELDLILCGHKHDGYIPRIIQKTGIIHDDFGFDVSDGKNIFDYIVSRTSNCRGEFDVLDAKMIVNRGYRKFSHKSPVFAALDKFSSRDMATITLKKKL